MLIAEVSIELSFNMGEVSIETSFKMGEVSMMASLFFFPAVTVVVQVVTAAVVVKQVASVLTMTVE
jgi:hypothetical protein